MENNRINKNVIISNLVDPRIIRLIVIAVIIGLIAIAGIMAVRTVDAGHQGVIVTFGEVGDTIYDEGGPYFVILFVQDIIGVNVQT